MNKKKSFTLVEIMVSFSILIVALTGIFLVLDFGESSSPLDLARVDVTTKARIIINRIANDLRGAYLQDIKDNAPSCSHIKFRKVQGVKTDTAGHYYNLSRNLNLGGVEYSDCSDYLEYSYDSDADKLTRLSQVINNENGDILSESTVEYKNISEGVFYVLNSGGSQVCLNEADLDNFIIVAIGVEEQGAATNLVSSSLTQRVKIRNDY
ncbi:MAG: type II secretion system GspH family protein [Candidatus Omnitrophica bacterium]|nr:type II secretion system GspH family protein [Candidatus Omnitrophota bacterium]MCF7893723.1 type II secretion system GspH family protein [Candidatus Omnitrophota bacterium]